MGRKADRRLMLGAAMDCRAASWCAKAGNKPLDNMSCDCGEPLPYRQHWLWSCCQASPQVPDEHHQPKGRMESTLAFRMVPRHPKPARRTTAIPRKLSNALAAARRNCADGPIYVATDGGTTAQKDRYLRISGWAAAFADNRVDTAARCAVTTSAGSVQGVDQCAYKIELTAATMVLRAAVAAQVPIHILVDNLTIARGVEQRLRGQVKPTRYQFGAWQDIQRLGNQLQELGHQSCCSWIPSHGSKLEEWTPPDGITNANARRLNDFADVAASRVAERRWLADRQAEADTIKGASAWTRAALLRLAKAEVQYTSRWITRGGDPFR